VIKLLGREREREEIKRGRKAQGERIIIIIIDS
jgi:hypothetical protein